MTFVVPVTIHPQIMQEASKSTEAARASHAVANNVGALGKSHPAVRPVPVQRVVGSASETYEEARKEEIDHTWNEVPKKIQLIKQQAIEQEKSAKDTTAFYQAAGLGSYALHQVIKVIYEAVNKVQAKDHVFFRAPGNPPRKETTDGPQRFLESRSDSSSWKDHDERDSLMSANIALQANVNSSAESSFDILQSGGLFNVDKGKMLQIIGKMLKSMTIASDIQTEILAEVEALGNAIEDIGLKSSTKESVLYQIFIPNDLVSQLVYIAQTNGHPFDYKYLFVKPEKILAGITAAGKELKDGSMESFGTENAAKYKEIDPYEEDEKKQAEDNQWKVTLFRSPEFTTRVLHAAKTTSFWLALKGDMEDPQARILMHPDHFAPGGRVKTQTYPNLTESTSTVLQQGLEKIGIAASKSKSTETPPGSGTPVEWGDFHSETPSESWADLSMFT